MLVGCPYLQLVPHPKLLPHSLQRLPHSCLQSMASNFSLTTKHPTCPSQPPTCPLPPTAMAPNYSLTTNPRTQTHKHTNTHKHKHRFKPAAVGSTIAGMCACVILASRSHSLCSVCLVSLSLVSRSHSLLCLGLTLSVFGVLLRPCVRALVRMREDRNVIQGKEMRPRFPLLPGRFLS